MLAEMESSVKRILKSLCYGYGWTYGVLWRFDQQNPMFLTPGDAYGDQMRGLVDDMLLQVHMLGQGIVGEAAFTGKDQWIHSQAHCPDESLMGSVSYQESKVGSECNDQFASGVKTVVAVPLGSQGVVQFGSTKTIPESLEFLDQTKNVFLGKLNVELLNSSPSLHCRNYGSDEWYDSLFSASSPFVFPPFPATPVSYNEASRNFQEDSPFANIEELLNVGTSAPFKSAYLVGNQSEIPQISSSLLDYQDGVKPVNRPSAQSESCIENDAFQWPVPNPGDIVQDLQSCPLRISRKGLFSELGLEQLLNGTVHNSASTDKCSYDDPYSTSKRRKTECGSTSGSKIQSQAYSCLSEKISSLQNHQEVAKPADLWLDDSYSINNASTNMKPAQESTKPVTKRAKPGESTRPRPKDRQQFQDRLGELRKMIPNTAKCSIDALLDSTIKHMCFLQNIAKHAENVKRIKDQKDKRLLTKDNANGATWAFEVCGEAMICPIKVEDVGPPGQMLIEMLCVDGGTFLEVADTIRGLGLRILHGSMEDGNTRTWAHFIVEASASRAVSRVDVFWSLARHLQQMDSINPRPVKVIDDRAAQHPPPISADAFR